MNNYMKVTLCQILILTLIIIYDCMLVINITQYLNVCLLHCNKDTLK